MFHKTLPFIYSETVYDTTGIKLGLMGETGNLCFIDFQLELVKVYD